MPARTRATSLAAALLVGLLLGIGAQGGGETDREHPARNGSGCAESLSVRVQAYYDRIRGLRADFEQVSRSVALGAGEAATQSSRGNVTLAKPGRMRWEYTGPEPSLVVSDGTTLWIYDPEASEVQVLPMTGDSLSGAGLQFLFGEGKLTDAFQIAARRCDTDRPELVLTPKDEALFERIILEVDPETGVARGTEIRDLFGNRTELVLHDIETDGDFDDGMFRFEPPEGTRVHRLEGP